MLVLVLVLTLALLLQLRENKKLSKEMSKWLAKESDAVEAGLYVPPFVPSISPDNGCPEPVLATGHIS